MWLIFILTIAYWLILWLLRIKICYKNKEFECLFTIINTKEYQFEYFLTHINV